MSQIDTLEPFAAQQMETGYFGDYRALVQQTLRLRQKREAELKALRASVNPSLNDLDRGEGLPLNMDEINARGERSLAGSKF